MVAVIAVAKPRNRLIQISFFIRCFNHAVTQSISIKVKFNSQYLTLNAKLAIENRIFYISIEEFEKTLKERLLADYPSGIFKETIVVHANLAWKD